MTHGAAQRTLIVRLATTAVVAWAGAATTRAAAPATTQAATTRAADDPDVATLIRRLGADEEEDRSAAQGQLVDLGTTAVDALRQAADHDGDPEVRSRAAAALARIRDRDANGPTLVTLHAHEQDPAAVFAQIGKQAHADVDGVVPGLFGLGREGVKVTVDANRKPFWDVMADVCGQLNVCPLLDTPSHGALRLIPTSRDWMKFGPHQVVGPFWVGVSSLYRLSSVDLDGPPRVNDVFLARLIVFPEPKLVVTQVSALAVREATDEAGNSLVPPTVGPAGRLAARAAARLPARMTEARLLYPDHPGKRITTLAGDVTVTLAQGAQRFEADDVMGRPTVTRPLPGVTVRVGVNRSATGVYLVTVECTRDGLPDPQWQAMTNRVGDLTVEDAAGHALTPRFWMVDAGNSDASFKATCQFTRSALGNLLVNALPGGPAAAPPPGEPARVVWNVAARFKVVTVPVAFHDLPMP